MPPRGGGAAARVPTDGADVVLIPVARSVLAGLGIEWVSQHTAATVFGIPPETFVAWCKAGRFPSRREGAGEGETSRGHLWFARASDVRAHLEQGVKVHKRARSVAPAGDDFEAWAESKGMVRRGA